jgi:hypothetical protein
MSKSTVKELKERVLDAEARAAYYESCVNAFFTGDVPNNASLEHMVLAKWGRQRLEELKRTPVLLKSVDK